MSLDIESLWRPLPLCEYGFEVRHEDLYFGGHCISDRSADWMVVRRPPSALIGSIGGLLFGGLGYCTKHLLNLLWQVVFLSLGICNLVRGNDSYLNGIS